MTATHVAVLLLSLLSCVTTALGALVLRENARALAAGTGFAAGIMILISLWELLPESIASD